MKNLFVMLTLILSFLFLKAGEKTTNYVTYEGKTYFCQKATPGLFNMNLTMDDGTILKVPIKKVDAYSCNGRLFERLPVMCEGATANCTALMEYVTSRNGFRLYKYCKVQEHGNLYDCTYQKAHKETTYFVYKDGKFHMQVTKENAESVLQYFNIKVI